MQGIHHSAQIVNSLESNLQPQTIINKELLHQTFLFPDNQPSISVQDENINSINVNDKTPSNNTNLLQNIEKENYDNLTPNDFKNKLTKLIIDDNFSRNKVNDLLCLLKNVNDINILKELPSDARTFLSCPTSGSLNFITQSDGGQYIHFELVDGLKYVLQLHTQWQTQDIFNLWISVDGTEILNNNFWPILSSIRNGSVLQVLVIGVYCGSLKPKLFSEYLSPLISDLKTVLTCGFNYNGYTKKLIFFGFIADAPAHTFLKCIKPHQSYYACEKCTVKGIYNKDRVCFPDRSCEL